MTINELNLVHFISFYFIYFKESNLIYLLIPGLLILGTTIIIFNNIIFERGGLLVRKVNEKAISLLQ